MNLQEDFCSQELYNLLIEKGFEVSSYDAPFTYRLVTHQSAMKWLRERHDFHIEVIYNLYYKEYKGCMYKNIGEYNYTEFYSTYEEAVEAALKYVLEKLI